MTETRPHLEVADVIRLHGDRYCREHHPSAAQKKVLRHIATCRTAALGGHIDECDRCGHQRISYNSCRDRHCPKCQALQRVQWLEQRLERLLPVPYFHVVFTLPEELNPLILRNKRIVYALLFDAAAQTLQEIARDPDHLGAEIAITAILHTWGQNLLFHPHLHCVVTGGGLSLDGKRWIAGRDHYFLPVQVLAKLFRGKFLAALDHAYKNASLDLAGSTARFTDPSEWKALRNELYQKNWIVYAKPPFGGPEQVFRYLGRYTHRVAISNHRLLTLRDGKVTFSRKDYAHGGARKTMMLDAAEFLRRFLLHVLPERFVRIRHYGLCAARNVETKLLAARSLLEPHTTRLPSATCSKQTWAERFREQTGIDLMACPQCGKPLIRRQLILPSNEPARSPWSHARASPAQTCEAA